MMNEKIVKVFRDGVDKGFNVNYVKKILIKKGYSKKDVNDSAEAFMRSSRMRKEAIYSQEIPNRKRPRKLVAKFRSQPFPYILNALLVILVTVLLVTAPGERIIYKQIESEKECKLDELDEQTLREQIDSYSEFSMKVDNQQQQIQDQIELIEELNLSVEEKEALVNAQIEEVKRLNDYIKEERIAVTRLLLEMINIILER